MDFKGILFRIFRLFIPIIMTVSSIFAPGVSMVKDTFFYVDTCSTGEEISNKLSNVNMWKPDGVLTPIPENGEADIRNFVKYIQLMTATGGSEDRDLFVDPTDRTNLYDYDFTRLINACRNIVNYGCKPHIKTGNVPMKYSSGAKTGGFGVNVCPPDDYNVYYKYIKAMGDALVEEFGREEVLSWRFGVFTEYENVEWFHAGNRDPKASFTEFCKIYDYTVQALIDSVGEDVFVGAHSMTVTEGLWDERDFIRHVAKGKNHCTGKKGTRICFLSVSYYDNQPGVYTSGMNLPRSVDHLRKKAECMGLKDLIYGVDEGRIHSGINSGTIGSELAMRITGYTWQGAYDARMLKQAVDNNIDYISSWGYLTDGLFTGIPTVSYHVADRFSKFAGMKKVNILTDLPFDYGFERLCDKPEKEIGAVAGVSSDENILRLMAYNYAADLNFSEEKTVHFKITSPEFKDRNVKITTWVVDDNANFFDQWQEDRITYGIGDDKFGWSPDDPGVDTFTTLRDPAAREFYFSNLRSKYEDCSRLVPLEEFAKFNGEFLDLTLTLKGNTVAFAEISCCE